MLALTSEVMFTTGVIQVSRIIVHVRLCTCRRTTCVVWPLQTSHYGFSE